MELARRWSDGVLPAEIATLLGNRPAFRDFTPSAAYAESRTRFDRRGGNTRNHDLLVEGTVGDEKVRAAAEHEERRAVLAGDGHGPAQVVRRDGAHEDVRGAAQAQRGVPAHRLMACAGRDGHAATRERRISRRRTPASRMLPAPRMRTT